MQTKKLLLMLMITALGLAWYGMTNSQDESADIPVQKTIKRDAIENIDGQHNAFTHTTNKHLPKVAVKAKKNDTQVTNELYWKKIKAIYGDDFASIRAAIKAGDIDGLSLFKELQASDSVEDKTWFIEITNNYDDENLFVDILDNSCCDQDDLSNHVFKFAIEQFNEAATNALLDKFDDYENQDNKDKTLFLLGGATAYTAGEDVHSRVIHWLEDKIYSQSAQSDVATVMAYFRASQGNTEQAAKAEGYLIDLFSDENRLLSGKIDIEKHFKNTLPSDHLLHKVDEIVGNQIISDKNKYALTEVTNYWRSIKMDLNNTNN